ncbi:hypothetical protein OIO90_006411 [Microbotryomycetes sp. JL221]|nr:hypothetical protein OIO90_006411 [Microbotryomycetes sp. JL221]
MVLWSSIKATLATTLLVTVCSVEGKPVDTNAAASSSKPWPQIPKPQTYNAPKGEVYVRPVSMAKGLTSETSTKGTKYMYFNGVGDMYTCSGVIIKSAGFVSTVDEAPKSTWSIDKTKGAYVRGQKPATTIKGANAKDYTMSFESMIEHGALGWRLDTEVDNIWAEGPLFVLTSNYPAGSFANINQTLFPPNSLVLGRGWLLQNQTTLTSAWHLDTYGVGKRPPYFPPCPYYSLAIGAGAQDTSAWYRNVKITLKKDGSTFYSNPMTSPDVLVEYGVETNDYTVCSDAGKRDRFSWLGDREISARSIEAMGRFDLVKGPAEQAFSRQAPSGQVPANTLLGKVDQQGGQGRTEAIDLILVDFDNKGLDVVYHYWMKTGDNAFVKQYWNQMVKMLDYTIKSSIDPKTNFGTNGGSGPTIDSSCNIVQSLEEMIKMGKAVGYGSDESLSRYSQQAALTRNAVNNLWNETGGYFHDPNGNGWTFTDLSWIEIIKAGTADQRNRFWSLLPSRAVPGGYADPPAGGNFNLLDSGLHPVKADSMAYLLWALGERGDGITAQGVIDRHYAIMADQSSVNYTGAYWEFLSQDGTYPGNDLETSQSHNWGSFPTAFMHEYVLGVTPKQPGFTEFNVKPLSNFDAGWVQGRVPTPLGLIYISLGKNKAGKWQIELTAPKGTKGYITMPFSGYYSVNGRSKQKGQLYVLGGSTTTNIVQVETQRFELVDSLVSHYDGSHEGQAEGTSVKIHEKVAARVLRQSKVAARLDSFRQRSNDTKDNDANHERVNDQTLASLYQNFKTIPRRDKTNKVRLRRYSTTGFNGSHKARQHSNSLVSSVELSFRTSPGPRNVTLGFHRTASLHTATLDEVAAVETAYEDDETTPPTIIEPTADKSLSWKEKNTIQTDKQPYGALIPGSFVEARRQVTAGQVSQGIIVGPNPTSPRNLLILSPSAEGETAFVDILADDITFVISKFISQSQARDCISLTPQHPMIIHLLQKIRHLSIRVERDTRLLTQQGFINLYDLASKHLEKQARTTSNDDTRYLDTSVALGLLGIPAPRTPSLHLAMHQLMFEDSLHYIADPASIRQTGKFYLRQQDELKDFKFVRQWTRDESNEFLSFVDKAKKVQQMKSQLVPKQHDEVANRKDNQIVWIDAPGIVWTDSDQTILRFLRSSLDNERAFQTHPHLSIVPTIIKSIESETTNHEFDRQRIRQFLSNVGVVAPWENWVAHELADLMNSKRTHTNLIESIGKFAKTNVEKYQQQRVKRPVQDQHDSVRHDFGSINVYVIDDVGAKELDDGISIEQATSTNSGEPTWWVHVHVADPTSVLHPNEPLSRLAAIRHHTEYFPEQTWPMLPQWFINHEQLSLGSKMNSINEGDKFQKTLVFSTRLTNEGNVCEIKVRAGVASNFKRLTYEAVDRLLGHESPRDRPTITLGNLPESAGQEQSSRPLDNDQLMTDERMQQDLRMLHKLSTAIMKRRTESNALFWTFPSFNINVNPSIRPRLKIFDNPQFALNSPQITMNLPTRDICSNENSFTPAQILVSEMMVCANRTAARFGVEQGIPMAFRSQAAPVSTSNENLDKVMNKRNSLTGEASVVEVLKARIDFLPAVTSTQPGQHWPMGIRDEFGYTRATSPLRRFADLFSHWQIKQRLLPLSQQIDPQQQQQFNNALFVERRIQQWELINKLRGRLSKHSEMFWACYVLKQKFDNLVTNNDSKQQEIETLLKSNLTAVVMREPAFSLIETLWTQPVWIVQLGLRATLRYQSKFDSSERGEFVNVQLDHVLVGARSRVLVSLRK